MSLLQAVLLALVQGATEFLPVSSSAHLVLLPWLLGWTDQGLAFDVAVNTGTLLAVIAYFRRDLARLLRGLWLCLRQAERFRQVLQPALRLESGLQEDVAQGRLALQLLVATVPAALFGLSAQRWISTAARNPVLIATTSIGFGLLLWLADWKGRRQRGMAGLGWRDALLVGLVQALALIPGTSRSGITMTAALVLGFDRNSAARFSFLLAIPISLLAAAKTALDVARDGFPSSTSWPATLLALVVSAVAAYAVIGWLLAWVQRQSMAVFAVYRVVLGLLILALVALR